MEETTVEVPYEENKEEKEEVPVKACSGRWFKVHWKKFVILAVLIGAITYVVIDAVEKSCISTEPIKKTVFRAKCDSTWGPKVENYTTANIFTSGFDCKTKDADAWYPHPATNATSCQEASSCVSDGIEQFLAWIEANVVVGFFVYSLAYMLATVLFVPGSLLTIGGGAAFGAALGLGLGTLVGFLSVWLGASIGACIAMPLGRFLLRDMVANLIKKFSVLTAIDTAIDKKGFLTVLLLRFSPVVPFNAFNYIMGATKVNYRDYCIASVLGMAPGTAAYVFIGAAIGVTANAGSGKNLDCDPDTTVTTVVLVVGIIATLIAVFLISWYSKKEFAKLSADGNDGNGDGDGSGTPYSGAITEDGVAEVDRVNSGTNLTRVHTSNGEEAAAVVTAQ